LFVQADDGIRDFHVTGVQTCALPIFIAISGPLRGWVFPITEEEFTFGQDETNQACLKDELVCRRHCSVRIENGCVVVRDLDSANGTVVSGEEIAAGGKRILTYMD